MEPNRELTLALAEAQMTVEDLADAVGVDLKTAQRWVNEGRTPHPPTRHAVANALGVTTMVLWPHKPTLSRAGASRDIRGAYSNQAGVPLDVWRDLICGARSQIILAGTTVGWLTNYVPNLQEELRARAAARVKIRAIIGEDSELIEADQLATGPVIPLLTDRIATSRNLLAPLAVDGVLQLRSTQSGYGRSVFLGDDQAVASWWIHGQPGTEHPFFHVKRVVPGGIFDGMAGHAEALWEGATPVALG